MVMADCGDRDRAAYRTPHKFTTRQDLEEEGVVGGVTGGVGGALTYGGTPQPIAIMKAPIILAKSTNQLLQRGLPNSDDIAETLTTLTSRQQINNHVITTGTSHADRSNGPVGGNGNGGGANPSWTPSAQLQVMSRSKGADLGGGQGVGREGGGVRGQYGGRQGRAITPVVVQDKPRLALPPAMPRAIKIVDESLTWCETGFEMLLDQSDFLVIGVLGLQGAGKSTLLSHLVSGAFKLPQKLYPFRAETRGMREGGSHMSAGIDMYITAERTILLDTQPMLSASILDSTAHLEGMYATSDNSVEIQSMQVATFMMTVCNVVLVVSDWFLDVNFIKFLLMAEMLKPATPMRSGGGASEEYYPDIVFVQNKAEGQEFSPTSVRAMRETLHQMMSDSRLGYFGMPGMNAPRLTAVRASGPTTKTGERSSGVNLFLLPAREEGANKKDDDPIGRLLTAGYRGNRGFDASVGELRRQLLSMPRRPLAHTTLSEKNWFHYAARTWDVVRKQQQLSEYSRLLS